jgi:hypothetical protein
MLKSIKIDIKYLLGSFAFIFIAYMTATGKILNYISFSDVLGEIGVFILTSTMGLVMFFSSFSKK